MRRSPPDTTSSGSRDGTSHSASCNPPRGHIEQAAAAPHEYFFYMIDGVLDAKVGGETRRLVAGDVAQIPRGAAYRIEVREPARHAGVRSTALLEAHIAKHGAADNWRG